jgi:hypothetical protein
VPQKAPATEPKRPSPPPKQAPSDNPLKPPAPEQEALHPMGTPHVGPAQVISSKAHVPLVREIPGRHTSQVKRANWQRNINRKIP